MLPEEERTSNSTAKEELPTRLDLPSSSNPRTSDSPKKRHWLPLVLILLTIILVIGGFSTFLISQNNERVDKDKKADAAHNAYIADLSGNGTIAFSDPLKEASGSQWKSEINTSGTCQWAQGAYHVKQQSAAFMKCNTREIYSDFTFEVQLTTIEGCGGIVFRDQRNGYFYYFSICPYGKLGRYNTARYANYGAFEQLPYGESSAIHVGTNQPNKIAVKASGNSMTFYINEQQIAQALDIPSVTYTEGTIGLAAYPNIGTVAHIAYTNATLWTL